MPSFFNPNCYDDDKAQRVAFVADGLIFTNENIDCEAGVNWHLASCTSNQFMLGETPCNSVTLSLFNDGGMVETDFNKEFKCSWGVESSRINFETIAKTTSYISHEGEVVQLLSVAPYWHTNCKFTSVSPLVGNGYDGKMMWFNNNLYIIFVDGEDRYYIKHPRLSPGSYGSYTTPSNFEKKLLDRIYDNYIYISVVFSKDYFAEYYNTGLSGTSTLNKVWNDYRSSTWNSMLSHTWDEYSSYCVIQELKYSTKPYGIWKFNRPRRMNDAIITLEGRDRMRFFEEDSLNFVRYNASLRKGLMTPRQYIKAIADYKNVPVGYLGALNGFADEVKIDPKVYYQQKTLKDMLSYAFEVSGSNGIIDPEGRLACLRTALMPYDVITGEPSEMIPFVYSYDVSDGYTPYINTALIYQENDTKLYEGDSSDADKYEWSDNPFFNKKSYNSSFFSNSWNAKYTSFRDAIVTSDGDNYVWSDSWLVFKENNIVYLLPIFTVDVMWNGFGTATYTCSGELSRMNNNYEIRSFAVTNHNDANLQGFNFASEEKTVVFNKQGMEVASKGLVVKNAAGETVFYADEEGNLILKGKLDGATGTFSGQLDAASGKFVGEVIAESGSFTGEIHATSGTFNGEVNATSGTFNGTVNASSGTFNGTINASAGTIGNWDITNNRLRCVNSSDATNYIEMGKYDSGMPMIHLGGTMPTSAGDAAFNTYFDYNGIIFKKGTTTRAYIDYYSSSRGETLEINASSDDQVDIRISAGYGALLGSPSTSVIGSTTLDLQGETINIDKPIYSSSSTLNVKNDLVKFSQPPWIDNTSSTTSGANTVLVAGSYGRKFYVVSSLKKNKANIKTIENASEKVDNLRGVSFTSKCEIDDPNTVYYGFIAEEVEKAVPELATYEDGKLRSVQYDRVCALLVEDNKACHRRIEDLEKRIEALENIVKELKK